MGSKGNPWSPRFRRIAKPDMESLILRTPRIQLVALGRGSPQAFRGHSYQTLPWADLWVRAKYEVKPGITTVVDCSTIISGLACQEALLDLWSEGFTDRLILT